MFNSWFTCFFDLNIYFCIIKKALNYVRNRGETLGKILCIGR